MDLQKHICRRLAVTLLVVVANLAALAQQKGDINPVELVRKAANNEIKSSDVESHYYMFKDAIQWKDHSVVREVLRTPEGGLVKTLSVNGHPLTAEERKRDDEKLRKFANDADARRKRREASRAEDKRAELMLTSLPDAFLYTYAGTQPGPNGEELVNLKFTPNPNFNPPNHETAVYQGMQGDMLIDRHALRIAKIDGTLFKDVDFGWGILGRLYKGGKFRIVQQDVGGGHWEEVEETLQMTGKILMVKSLTVWSTEIMTDFRPVPGNLTTAQAIDMLHNADTVADNGGGVKEAHNTGQGEHK